MPKSLDKYRKEFLDYLKRERNYSSNTINSYRTDLLQFCQFTEHLEEVGKTFSDNSLININIVKLFVHKVLAYTKEEIIKGELKLDFSRYDDWMIKQDKVMLLLFYSTGINLSQLVEIDEADLKLNQKKIKVAGVAGKEYKSRSISFCNQTGKAIKSFLQDRKNYLDINTIDKPLFISKQGIRISKSIVQTRLNKFFANTSGSSGFTSKFLRNLFATHLYDKGLNKSEIKNLLIEHIDLFISKEGKLNELYQLLKSPQSISTRSRSRKLSTVKSFFKFLLKKGIIDYNPASPLKSPRYKVNPPKVLEQTIMKILLTPIEPEDWEISRDRTMLEVFYSTGIRLTELTQIKIGDINFTQNQIIIFGKGRKERMVFFGKEVAKALKVYLSDHESYLSKYYMEKERSIRPLFITKRGNRIKQREVQERLKIFFEYIASNLSKTKNKSQTNISILLSSINPTPHLIRHTFATHLINEGAKMEVVKDLLGHEKLSTTQIYTHLDVKGMKKIIDKAHPHA